MAEYENARESSDQERGGFTRRYTPKPRFCQFCSDKTVEIDYKNTALLRRFTSEEGKIRPRRQTGTCAKHQRKVAIEIKRSRHIALLPFTGGTWEEKAR